MKFGDKLRQIIGVAAPTIGVALGGPIGGLAGSFVSKALGVDDEQAALQKLETDPGAMLALKQAELDFQKHLEDCNIQLEQIAADDRKDARDRQIAMKDNVPQQVLWLTGIGFFASLAFMQIHGVPPDSQILIYMTATLGTAFTTAVAYFVGSSAGSRNKDATIAAASTAAK